VAISFQIKESNQGLIKLPERFDFGCVHEFRSCYESVDVSKIASVTIDFSSTKMMDSSALGMLINLKKFFEASGKKIAISNCNPQIKKIFSISNFEKLFNFV
jgi:anti-anti-sigma factor